MFSLDFARECECHPSDHDEIFSICTGIVSNAAQCKKSRSLQLKKHFNVILYTPVQHNVLPSDHKLFYDCRF